MRPGLRNWWVAALVAALFASAGLAQDAAPTTATESPAEALIEDVSTDATVPDYEAWAKVANRAERALETARASDPAFEALRTEVVDWRTQFGEAREANAVRIATLRNQLEALGPVPDEGAGESDAVAEQRAALTQTLFELETPVRAAELAFARADTIVEEVDALLRARQSEALFSLGPSPLNPVHYPAAIEAVTDTLRHAWHGTKSAIASEAQRSEFKREFALVMLLLIVGLMLMFRGSAFVARASAEISARAEEPVAGVWRFVVWIGQVVMPTLGLFTVILAINLTGLMGLRAQLISEMALAIGVSFFTARWLAGRVFGAPGSPYAVLELDKAGQTETRYEAMIVGLAYGLFVLLERLAAFESYSETTLSIITLPVVVLAGILMIRMGRVIQTQGGAAAAQARPDAAQSLDGSRFVERTFALAGKILVVVGVVGPALAALGFGQLGGMIVFSTVLSVALVGALLVLHSFFVDLYGTIRGFDADETQQALFPLLFSAMALLASVPVFALIWGAREAQIGEIWSAIWGGVSVGGIVVTPSDIVLLIGVFLIGVGLTRLIQGMLKSTVLPKTHIDVGGRNAITSGIGYFGIFIALLVAVGSVGINLSSIAVVAGALSVGIGFGLQTIVSNFISGIILLVERPISEGDWIKAGEHSGIVRDISVRATRIETFDRTDVVVPNSDLISGVVTNYTRGNRIGRLVIDLGVAYGSDTRRVADILREVVAAHPVVTVDPPPQVGFMNFGADALEFQIRAVLSDVHMVLTVRDEINHAIAERFEAEGIEIPFAQRDIWIRNPESLRPDGDE